MSQRVSNEQLSDLLRRYCRYLDGRINTVTGKREWDTFHGLPIPALLADLEEARRDHQRTEQWYGQRWRRLRDLFDGTEFEESACAIMANGTASTEERPRAYVFARELEAAERERDEVRAALRAVEWSGSDQENCCPCCGNWKSEGHVDDCLVGNALAASEQSS